MGHRDHRDHALYGDHKNDDLMHDGREHNDLGDGVLDHGAVEYDSHDLRDHSHDSHVYRDHSHDSHNHDDLIRDDLHNNHDVADSHGVDSHDEDPCNEQQQAHHGMLLTN